MNTSNTSIYQQTDLFPIEKSSPLPFILSQLDVYNWGPFGGCHTMQFDPAGTAIVGPSGSGKTSLVDAIMTLITAQPKYNLASTGGYESDRDLMFYIRGKSGDGNNTEDNSHIARPDKTITGIRAHFSNGHQSIHIGVLFWMPGPGFSSDDRQDAWIFSQDNTYSLIDWLETYQRGGKRALKQLGRETAGLQIFDTKKAYLAQVRRFFEVGENAFTLLNRTAGLKQINSIDEIFRELVLDDRSAFERAAEVVKEFDNLAAIHSELETARKQQQSLAPIHIAYENHQDIKQKLLEQNTLYEIVPIWFASASYTLWNIRIETLQKNITLQIEEISTTEKKAAQLQYQADQLKAIYMQAGGTNIEQLKNQIHTQTHLTAEKERNARDYQKLVQVFNFDASLTPEILKTNQQKALEQQAQVEAQQKVQEEAHMQCSALLVEKQNAANTLRAEIEKISAHPDSSIPGVYQDFRSELANALDLPTEGIPYVAELLEVKPEESRWRGAIERTLGGHRLRILIPPQQMQAALGWVNDRNNRLHVRLLEAKPVQHAISFFEDGFTRKLNFKNHPFRESLKAFLAEIDRHCVASPEVLHQTPHGMTPEGLMSGVAGRFEKQDQQPLHKNWMTGFNNKDLLANLNAELQEIKIALAQYQKDYDLANQKTNTHLQHIAQLTRLTEINFDAINLPGATENLEKLQQQLQLLNDPNSAAGKARQRYEALERTLLEIRSGIKNQEREKAQLEERLEQASQSQHKAFLRIGSGVTDTQQQLAKNFLPVADTMHLDEIDQKEREARDRVAKLRDALNAKLSEVEKNLVRLMALAKQIDTGALHEIGTQLQDIPLYVERLQMLSTEALPEKLHRFLAYLNQSSDQGVTQLLADIENEVGMIEERIHDLNSTLQRVDYQPDRYLQLVPQRVTHEILRTLQQAQKHLRAAVLHHDQGESHYRALKEVITILRDTAENKRILRHRSLLDPRYRLQFFVSVLDRTSHALIEMRTSSAGGSGGQKEIIASYILIASLSYALCPEGATHPLFSTIILDEAFSKSSQFVARRIVSALKEFKLHPLFVTPNKEMQLLKDHTRSVIVVHRKGLQSKLTSMRWESVKEHAQQKNHIPLALDEVT